MLTALKARKTLQTLSAASFVTALAVGAGVAALPLTVEVGQSGLLVKAASAQAKDGGRGESSGHGRGRGGDDHGGRSGRSEAGDDHGGRSSHAEDGDHHGRHGGDDKGDDKGADNKGADDRGDDRRAERGEDGGRRGAHHVDPATGAKVERNGNSIEVVNADGTKEEIENGRYEMKNAAGRTVVERPATAADKARLFGLVR